MAQAFLLDWVLDLQFSQTIKGTSWNNSTEIFSPYKIYCIDISQQQLFQVLNSERLNKIPFPNFSPRRPSLPDTSSRRIDYRSVWSRGSDQRLAGLSVSSNTFMTSQIFKWLFFDPVLATTKLYIFEYIN